MRRLCERGRGSRGMGSGVWAGLLLVPAPSGQAECLGTGCVPGPAVSLVKWVLVGKQRSACAPCPLGAPELGIEARAWQTQLP